MTINYVIASWSGLRRSNPKPYLDDRARSAALMAVKKQFGRLPYAESVHHGECKFEGQFGLSASIQAAGWTIEDLLPMFRIAAWSPGGETMKAGPQEKPLILVPVQSLL